jgi:TPR repeat protein
VFKAQTRGSYARHKCFIIASYFSHFDVASHEFLGTAATTTLEDQMNATLTINEPALSDDQSERMRALAQGGDKDAERVLTLAKAADLENAGAQFYLAHSLQEGALGLTPDPVRARKLFARAAKNGYPGAQAELDRLEKPATTSLSPKNAGVNVKLPPLTAKQQELVRFDDAIIRLAVRAYILSMPIFFKEDDLIPLIAANKAHFVDGGMVILYLKTAGSAMAQGALAFHGDSSAQSMFGTSAKTQQMAKQADEQMRSQGIGLGEDFLWLAKVLPPAAVGNWGPLQAHSQLSPYRQQMLFQVQTWRMNPQVGQAIIAQLQEKFSTVEQELYDAVCQLDVSLPADYRETEPRLEPVRMQREGDNPAGSMSERPMFASIPNEEVDQCRKAAEEGYAPAQNNLGVMYEQGQGVVQNYAEAANWYRKAAEQGWAFAQYNLGCLYANGNGVEQNPVEAAKLHRQAAEQGYAPAQFMVGYLYTMLKNNAEAEKWYRKAAEQGNIAAQKELDRISGK